MGEGIFVLGGQRLTLEIEGTEVAQRQMAVYKGKREALY